MTFNIKSYLTLCLVILFAACSKDDDPVLAPPAMSDIEIGSGNSKIGYAGGDIHVEAKITAPAKLASVTVTITPQEGTGWGIDTTYTEGFTGLLNAELHEHIDIPAEAPTGNYNLKIIVTDQAGKKTETAAVVEIKLDPTLPNLEDFEVSLSEDKTDLHVGGHIEAVNKIAKVELEVHGGGWEKDYDLTNEAMVGQTTYHLHAHVNVADAPAGHYHLHLKITDQSGKEMEFEEHFDK